MQRRGADEFDLIDLAGAGQFGVLGEKSVAGMNGVDLVLFCQCDQVADVEIRLDRLAAGFGADQERFIRLETMQREAVFVAVDGDGAQAQLRGRAKDADGDFGSVGNQQLLHERPFFPCFSRPKPPTLPLQTGGIVWGKRDFARMTEVNRGDAEAQRIEK